MGEPGIHARPHAAACPPALPAPAGPPAQPAPACQPLPAGRTHAPYISLGRWLMCASGESLPMDPSGSAAALAMGASITSRVSTWKETGPDSTGMCDGGPCPGGGAPTSPPQPPSPLPCACHGRQLGTARHAKQSPCTAGPPNTRPGTRPHRVAKGLEGLHQASHAVRAVGAVGAGAVAVAVGGGGAVGQGLVDGRAHIVCGMDGGGGTIGGDEQKVCAPRPPAPASTVARCCMLPLLLGCPHPPTRTRKHTNPPSAGSAF